MRIKLKRIRVFPNPWGVHPGAIANGSAPNHHTMDAVGRPCGLCMTDPEEGGAPGRIVGAWHDAVFLTEIEKGEFRNRRQSTGYKFLGCSNSETKPFQLAAELATKDPVELKASAYYLERLRDGSLIAADAMTARLAGVPFVDAEELFPKLAKGCADMFNAHFDDGVDAYVHFVGERNDAAAKAPPAAPAAPAASTDSPEHEDHDDAPDSVPNVTFVQS